MKLPRNLSGTQLIKALERLGYQPVRQTGSHVRLTSHPLPNPLVKKLAIRLSPQAGKSLVIPQAGEGANESLRESHVNEHHLTVPLHDPLRIGTRGYHSRCSIAPWHDTRCLNRQIIRQIAFP